MENSEATITLVSHDDANFTLPAKAVRLSKFITNAISKYFEDEDDEDTEPTNIEAVDVQRVGSVALGKVVQFLEHYVEEPMTEIPTPLGGNTFEEVMSQKWYQEFVAEENMSRDLLFEVLTAANYMLIQPLLDLACLKLTFHLTNKNQDEIRAILNLPALTPEEEAQAREEHRWIFDDN